MLKSAESQKGVQVCITKYRNQHPSGPLQMKRRHVSNAIFILPFSYFPFQKHNNPAWIRFLKIDVNCTDRDTDNSSLSLFIFGSMSRDSISILYYPILPVSAPWFTPFNLFFLCFLFNTYLWGVNDRYLSITLVHLFNYDKYIIRVCANSQSMCSQIVF